MFTEVEKKWLPRTLIFNGSFEVAFLNLKQVKGYGRIPRSLPTKIGHFFVQFKKFEKKILKLKKIFQNFRVQNNFGKMFGKILKLEKFLGKILRQFF